MQAVYDLQAEELDDRFINAIKTAFSGRRIHIEIRDHLEDDNTYLHSLEQSLEEWNSEEDNQAYHDL